MLWPDLVPLATAQQAWLSWVGWTRALRMGFGSGGLQSICSWHSRLTAFPAVQKQIPLTRLSWGFTPDRTIQTKNNSTHSCTIMPDIHCGLNLECVIIRWDQMLLRRPPGIIISGNQSSGLQKSDKIHHLFPVTWIEMHAGKWLSCYPWSTQDNEPGRDLQMGSEVELSDWLITHKHKGRKF